MSLSYGFCLDEPGTVYTSGQFSETISRFSGHGVCEYGSRFKLSLGSGFLIYIGTGYAISGGRFLKNDEPYQLTITPNSGPVDRIDAIAVKTDVPGKSTSLSVIEGVNIQAILENPGIIRNENSYSIILYTVRVRHGSSSIQTSDITDYREDQTLCGEIRKVGNFSTEALEAYSFLYLGGYDEADQKLLDYSNAKITDAEEKIAQLSKKISEKTGVIIGDVVVSSKKPRPESNWLLCDGSFLSISEYRELYILLNARLPNLSKETDRFKAYIYGGYPGR